MSHALWRRQAMYPPAPSRCCSELTCIRSDVWVCLISEIFPSKQKCCRNLWCSSSPQHVLVQEAGQPSLRFITRQDQCTRHYFQTTSFSFLVKSLKMIVSSILASAAVPDHNFIVKTIPVLSLVLPLGFIFSQSGMTSAFKQHPLSSCLFSWQIFRIWKMSMTREVERGENPFHLKFFNIFSKSPCTGSQNTINALSNCRSLTGCRRYDYKEFNDH